VTGGEQVEKNKNGKIISKYLMSVVRIVSKLGALPVDGLSSTNSVGELIRFGTLVPALSTVVQGRVLWVELDEGKPDAGDKGDGETQAEEKHPGSNNDGLSDGGSEDESKQDSASDDGEGDSKSDVDGIENLDSKGEAGDGAEGKAVEPPRPTRRWVCSPNEKGEDIFVSCDAADEIWEYCQLHEKLGRDVKAKTWHEKNVLFLVERFPDVLTAQDEDGLTLLHRICCMEGITLELLSGVLCFGTAQRALCMPSHSERLPLHCLCMNSSLENDGEGAEMLELVLANTPQDVALQYTKSGHTFLHLLLCNKSVRTKHVQTALRCSDRLLCTMVTIPHGVSPLEMARMNRLQNVIIADLYVACPGTTASQRLEKKLLAPFLYHDELFTEEVLQRCPYAICANSTGEMDRQPEELAEIVAFYESLAASSSHQDILEYIAPNALTSTNSVVGQSQAKARMLFLQYKTSNEIRKAIEGNKALIRFQRLLSSAWSRSYRDCQGRTVLMLAAMHDEVYLIDELVNAGADMEDVDHSGFTALCCSLMNVSHFSNRGSQWPEPLRPVRAARALLHHGAKIASLQRTPAAAELAKAAVGNFYALLTKETNERRTVADTDSKLDIAETDAKSEAKETEAKVEPTLLSTAPSNEEDGKEVPTDGIEIPADGSKEVPVDVKEIPAEKPSADEKGRCCDLYFLFKCPQKSKPIKTELALALTPKLVYPPRPPLKTSRSGRESARYRSHSCRKARRHTHRKNGEGAVCNALLFVRNDKRNFSRTTCNTLPAI
jgi:ankyrin repeat protein